MDAVEVDTGDYILAFIQLVNAILAFNLWRNYTKTVYERRFWVRGIFLKREEKGYFRHLIQEMRDGDSEKHYMFFRMTKEQFDFILSLIRDKISKKTTNFRKPICAEERLALCLRYLASGDTQVSLCFGFRISKTAISNIIRETCEAIWEAMSHIYVKMPQNPVEWAEISKGFYEEWDLPHCCGSIDGKHVYIQCPANSGSKYYNYKKSFSVILMAMCDAHYRFTMVDIGSYGSESDGGIFTSSVFGAKVKHNRLPLPHPRSLPNSNIKFPYYFIGDEAFPQLPNLMRPYSTSKGVTMTQRIFNYRLSRARRVIENTFGIMAAQWGIYQKTIKANPENVDRIIKATVCLHNYLITDELGKSKHQRRYNPVELADFEDDTGELTENGLWRNLLQGDGAIRDLVEHRRPNQRSQIAQVLKDRLAGYLSNEGAIDKQIPQVTRM